MLPLNRQGLKWHLAACMDGRSVHVCCCNWYFSHELRKSLLLRTYTVQDWFSSSKDPSSASFYFKLKTAYECIENGRHWAYPCLCLPLPSELCSRHYGWQSWVKGLQTLRNSEYVGIVAQSHCHWRFAQSSGTFRGVVNTSIQTGSCLLRSRGTTFRRRKPSIRLWEPEKGKSLRTI